ncbi:hypothetical protein BP5796_11227 [Coleophoma crateriformis]|uniref:Uncharacterized protein n=1 Tax=Coleophoma crateriformis TaxID=565419 RepID=A0A3D8QHQ4_9HELO|nr:hypothetical protein BP5796_11227 [Coleophoma crateriformis]
MSVPSFFQVPQGPHCNPINIYFRGREEAYGKRPSPGLRKEKMEAFCKRLDKAGFLDADSPRSQIIAQSKNPRIKAFSKLLRQATSTRSDGERALMFRKLCHKVLDFRDLYDSGLASYASYAQFQDIFFPEPVDNMDQVGTPLAEDNMWQPRVATKVEAASSASADLSSISMKAPEQGDTSQTDGEVLNRATVNHASTSAFTPSTVIVEQSKWPQVGNRKRAASSEIHRSDIDEDIEENTSSSSNTEPSFKKVKASGVSSENSCLPSLQREYGNPELQCTTLEGNNRKRTQCVSRGRGSCEPGSKAAESFHAAALK